MTMMPDDVWYKEITEEITNRYILAADHHWRRNSASQYEHLSIKAVEYPPDIDPDFRNRHALEKLLTLISAVQSEEFDPQKITERMLKYLAIWLCAYFLGVPQPHLWEEMARLANRRGAYPGLGYYDKLAGDVYRHERKTRAKQSNSERGAGNQRDCILVMAFTPTVLIPDEHDKAIESSYLQSPQPKGDLLSNDNVHEFLRDSIRRGQRTEEDALRESSETREFCIALERLACRYLRLQAWLYIAHGLDIVYLFQRQSAQEEIIELASAGEEMDTGILRGMSDERVARFFKSPNNSADKSRIQVLAGIKRDEMKGRGLCTCTLGHQSGVITTRPFKRRQSIQCCSWIQDSLLAAERAKILKLIVDEHSPSREDERVRPVYYNSDRPFSSDWWGDPDIKPNESPCSVEDIAIHPTTAPQ